MLFKDNVCVAFCLSNATLTDGGEVGGGRRGGAHPFSSHLRGTPSVDWAKVLGGWVTEALLLCLCGKKNKSKTLACLLILTKLFRNPETNPDVNRFSVLPKWHWFGQLLG